MTIPSGTRPGSYDIVAPLLHVLLGECDKALAQLDVAYRDHSSWLFQLQEPMWDPIRSHPRFKDLHRRVNLPPG